MWDYPDREAIEADHPKIHREKPVSSLDKLARSRYNINKPYLHPVVYLVVVHRQWRFRVCISAHSQSAAQTTFGQATTAQMPWMRIMP